MRTLRAPGGCPWDREQTLQSLRPFVLEETYELLDALDRQDLDGLREELGDFLYEAVFLAQIAEEAGHFSIADAVEGIAGKLVRRHPHVFTPDGRPLAEAPTSPPARCGAAGRTSRPRSARPRGGTTESALRGVPVSMPALLRAYELTARAAAVGFDWTSPGDVLDKIDEEVREVRAAASSGSRRRARGRSRRPALCHRQLRAQARHRARGGAARRDRASSSSASRAWRNWPAPTARLLASLSLDEQNALWDRVKAEATGGAATTPPPAERDDRHRAAVGAHRHLAVAIGAPHLDAGRGQAVEGRPAPDGRTDRRRRR